MLGIFLRSKFAVVLAILGLLVLGLGIGQRTIWLPPATVTAGVQGELTPAPLTVITPEVLKAKDGNFTLTIKSSGPIQLAVGQQRDIVGWIGDAAYTSVTGVNEDFSALTTVSKAGTETVPNPAGSDMWVSEEKATGELTYTWQEPGHGDWALLISSDGTAAAPTQISLTTDNDTSTPWAIPLMILGAVLLALAALLFWMAPRKSKTAVAATPGRRAAGKVPSDPATGAIQMAKIVAAKEEAAKEAAAKNEPEAKLDTIADVRRSARAAESASDALDADATAAAPDGTDAASLPQDFVAEGAQSASALLNGDALVNEDNDAKDRADAKDSAKNTDDGDNTDSSDGGSADGGSTDGAGKSSSVTDASSDTAADPEQDANKTDKKEFAAENPSANAAEQKASKKYTMGIKARWSAALTALVVVSGAAPALAEDATPPVTSTASDTATASSSATATATAATAAATDTATASSSASTPAETQAAGIPTLLDTQVQRIAVAVATVVATGDTAKNAKELESRVSGLALVARTANYKIRSTVTKQAAPEPVNGEKILTRVVSTSSTWPRSTMIVTQGENNALPQLLTLVQNSPREEYKLITATPLLPGQTFPTVDKEGAADVALDSATGLLMSPNDAVAALGDRLTNTASKWKGSFKDSVYITDVGTYQAKLLTDTYSTFAFSHKADEKATVAMRTADGGAMVVVGYTFAVDSTPKKDAGSALTDPAIIALAGGDKSTSGVVVSYAEPVVMYIPPAGSNAQINIVSATRDLVGAKFK